jgi:hypothetical protein
MDLVLSIGSLPIFVFLRIFGGTAFPMFLNHINVMREDR